MLPFAGCCVKSPSHAVSCGDQGCMAYTYRNSEALATYTAFREAAQGMRGEAAASPPCASCSPAPLPVHREVAFVSSPACLLHPVKPRAASPP